MAIVVEMTIAGPGAVFPLELVVFGHDFVPALVHGLETDGGLVDAMLVLEDGGGKARISEGEGNAQRVGRRVSAPERKRMGRVLKASLNRWMISRPHVEQEKEGEGEWVGKRKEVR